MKDQLLSQVAATKEFFDRSTRCLTDEHESYAPADGMFTVAQQIAHVGQTVDWFVDGVSKPEGFDMNFEEHDRHTRAVTTLAEARALYEKAFARVRDFIESNSDAYLSEPVPGPVLNGAPRSALVGGIVDHTSHHRGALTVYSRTLGMTPPMPYMEVETA